MKHDAVCRFRLSNDLLDELKVAAEDHGETLSSYMRQAATAHARSRDPQTDKQILGELVSLRSALGRVGNNLNQIAQRLNRGDRVEDKQMTAALADLQEMRRQVADALRDRQAVL